MAIWYRFDKTHSISLIDTGKVWHCYRFDFGRGLADVESWFLSFFSNLLYSGWVWQASAALLRWLSCVGGRVSLCPLHLRYQWEAHGFHFWHVFQVRRVWSYILCLLSYASGRNYYGQAILNNWSHKSEEHQLCKTNHNKLLFQNELIFTIYHEEKLNSYSWYLLLAECQFMMQTCDKFKYFWWCNFG